jgi:hypothetical protein
MQVIRTATTHIVPSPLGHVELRFDAPEPRNGPVPSTPGRLRRAAARLLLAASRRLAGEQPRPGQASSASLTSLSASSLCSRRTAV